MRRLRRLRNEDDGNSLILVMLIALLVTIMVGTASTAIVGVIKPSQRSVDVGAAVAAAQAGIEDYAARLNQQCSTGIPCAWVASHPDLTSAAGSSPATVVGSNGAQTKGSFTWLIKNKTTWVTDGFIRLQATGYSDYGKPWQTSRTYIADLNSGPRFSQFLYYTKYEALSPLYLTDKYSSGRAIQMTDPSVYNTIFPNTYRPSANGAVTWNGVTAASATQTNSNDVSLCADEWYPNPKTGQPGRGTAAAYGNISRWLWPTGRADSTAGANALPPPDPSHPAVFAETGSSPVVSGTPTHYGNCDVSFDDGWVMNGPVYTHDAFVLDNVSNGANRGPEFDAPAYSGWNGQDNPNPPPNNTKHYRSDSYNGGTPQGTFASFFPLPPTGDLQLPSSAVDAKDPSKVRTGALICVYTGPTRIRISGSTAHITSPGTDQSAASSCFTSHGAANTNSSAAGGGVYDAWVNTANTVVYVQNPSPITPSVSDPSHPIFQVQASPSIPAPPASRESTNTDPAVTPNDPNGYPSTDSKWAKTWTTWTNSTNCSPTTNYAAFAGTDERRFECELDTSNANKGNSYDSSKSLYGQVLTAVTNDFTAAPNGNLNLQTELVAKLNGFTHASGVTVGTSLPASPAENAVYYRVSTSSAAAATSTKSLSVGVTAPTSDSFLQAKDGTAAYVQTKNPTVTTATVTRFEAHCWNAAHAPVACALLQTPTWGSHSSDAATGDAQFTAKSTYSVYTNGPATVTDATATFPWFNGKSSYQQTDPKYDITQYSNGYGDAYVDTTAGTAASSLDGQMDIVAEHDVVMTNLAQYANPGSSGLALIAINNARIYHPIYCVSGDSGAIATPTAKGWCPNDITGLYNPGTNSKLSAATLKQNLPPSRYNEIALSPPITGTKPQPNEISAVVYAFKGSFGVDNWDRAQDLGYLELRGGMYMYNRGAMGRSWKDGLPSDSAASPFHTGFALEYTYDNLESRLPWIPPSTSNATGRTWNVISISTG